MRLLKLSSSRRSVRRFKRDEIGFKDLTYILNVARHAPSGANRQPWRFLVILDDKKRKILRELCENVERKLHREVSGWFKNWLREKGITWKKEFLSEAPLLILVFGKTDEPYWKESVWIAIGYLILAAEELGYATLTYTPPDSSWVYEVLNIPEIYSLEAIIPLGKSNERPEASDRLDLNEVVYVEEWGVGLTTYGSDNLNDRVEYL